MTKDKDNDKNNPTKLGKKAEVISIKAAQNIRKAARDKHLYDKAAEKQADARNARITDYPDSRLNKLFGHLLECVDELAGQVERLSDQNKRLLEYFKMHLVKDHGVDLNKRD